MTDKNKIKETDLQDVAGGRADVNKPTAEPQNPGFSADPSTSKGSTRPLTPEEAASVSGGRQSPTPTPSFESGDVNPESANTPRGGK